MGITKRQIDEAFEELGKPLDVMARQVAFGSNDYGSDALSHRPILSAALSDERSLERLRQEKYEVLRTKATYKRCLDEAAKRWEWRTLPL